MDQHRLQLQQLWEQTNWNCVRLNCNRCNHFDQSLPPPSAGSYGSSLADYEDHLGPLPNKILGLRILLLFKDPRDAESHFTIAPPSKRSSEYSARDHRYFCLTNVAWQNLGLAKLTGSAMPCWPDRNTSPAYFRRYLIQQRSLWSYDGFLAYFLYLLRPDAAVVTNVAKCYFTEKSFNRARKFCAAYFLRQEIEILGPTLVVSFLSDLRDAQKLEAITAQTVRAPVLSLYHPAAARGGITPKRKVDQLVAQMEKNSSALKKLNIDPAAVVDQVQRDARIVLPSIAADKR